MEEKRKLRKGGVATIFYNYYAIIVGVTVKDSYWHIDPDILKNLGYDSGMLIPSNVIKQYGEQIPGAFGMTSGIYTKIRRCPVGESPSLWHDYLRISDVDTNVSPLENTLFRARPIERISTPSRKAALSICEEWESMHVVSNCVSVLDSLLGVDLKSEHGHLEFGYDTHTEQFWRPVNFKPKRGHLKKSNSNGEVL